MNLTLNVIREKSPCHEGWTKLLTTLGKTKADDEPLELLTVLNSNGMDDALWVLANTGCYERLYRHFIAWRAEQLLPIFEAQFPNDTRPRNAIAIARDDTATDQDRAAARTAAWDAASAALGAQGDVWDAARDAARAARAARDAVWNASRAASVDASRAARAERDALRAAWDAHDAHIAAVLAWTAVGTAGDTAGDDEWDAQTDTLDAGSDAGSEAEDAARAAQSAQLRKMLTEGF